MKKIGFIAAMAWFGFYVRAQTNAAVSVSPENPAATHLTATNAPVKTASSAAKSQTLIESDGPADFDLTGRKVTYHRNVRVDDSQMKLRCEWLVAELPESGGRINHIVAETNVVINFTDDKGRTMRATGEKAVYDFHVENGVTNETVTLTGDPEIENAQGKSTGDVIVWDRAQNHLHITNPKMVIEQDFNGAAAGTNSPAEKTNSNSISETNLPQETINRAPTNSLASP